MIVFVIFRFCSSALSFNLTNFFCSYRENWDPVTRDAISCAAATTLTGFLRVGLPRASVVGVIAGGTMYGLLSWKRTNVDTHPLRNQGWRRRFHDPLWK